MSKLRALILILAMVFTTGFVGVLLTNLAGDAAGNLWNIPLSTYQIAATAGIMAVFAYLGTVVFPVIIKPSAALKLPEA
jgi:hypothetical protein